LFVLLFFVFSLASSKISTNKDKEYFFYKITFSFPFQSGFIAAYIFLSTPCIEYLVKKKDKFVSDLRNIEIKTKV